MSFFSNVPERLSPEWVQQHVNPLFSRILNRSDAYFANHSLGRPLDRTAQDITEGAEYWFNDMDAAWGPWMDEAHAFGERVKALIQWPSEGGVTGKASCGQSLRAVLNSFQNHPIKVIATRGEFDSIDFILKTYADLGLVEVHWIEPSRSEHNIAIYDPISYLEALDSPSDLVIASVVHFATGQVLGGLDKIIAKAHGQGAKVILDTYHSAGVLNWDAPEADFAMGGCYKYLRGGPGACFLAVHPRWLDNPEFRTLDTGWFAKQEPFSYARPDHNPRGEGIQSWAESTPTVLPPYQARAGLEFALEIGVDRMRAYNLEILAEVRQILKPHGGYTPSDPNAWGGYALLPMGSTESATRVSNLLKDEGVNTDSRSGCVRFGPDVLTSAEDIRLLVSALKKVIS